MSLSVIVLRLMDAWWCGHDPVMGTLWMGLWGDDEAVTVAFLRCTSAALVVFACSLVSTFLGACTLSFHPRPPAAILHKFVTIMTPPHCLLLPLFPQPHISPCNLAPLLPSQSLILLKHTPLPFSLPFPRCLLPSPMQRRSTSFCPATTTCGVTSRGTSPSAPRSLPQWPACQRPRAWAPRPGLCFNTCTCARLIVARQSSVWSRTMWL